MWLSPAQQLVVERVNRFSKHSFVTLLLEGEQGTGKTQLAQGIHDRSSMAKGPFHAVSLAALEDSLAASELFGYVKGAFTGASTQRAGAFVSANGGTLFLDEIGKASLAVQRKLLVAIEGLHVQPLGSDRTRRVDTRIIAATNVELASLVASERMLPDLVSRIGSFRIRLLPLRERREDIPLLVEQLLGKHASKFGYRRHPEVEDALLRALANAPFPGNLRELDATIQRILMDAEGAPTLLLDHCNDDLEYLRPLGGKARQVSAQQAHSVAGSMNNRKEAAAKLGVSLSTLHRRLRQPQQADDVRLTVADDKSVRDLSPRLIGDSNSDVII